MVANLKKKMDSQQPPAVMWKCWLSRVGLAIETTVTTIKLGGDGVLLAGL